VTSLERNGEIYLLRLGDGENRFDRTSVDALGGALDEVEHADGPRALVITGAGKFFSNGLDLDYLRSGAEPAPVFLRDVMTLWARVLAFPVPTVAAVNGHAFAGGAMFALAADRRVMRADRGFWCINEIQLGMVLAPGMRELIRCRLTPQTTHIAITAGHRFAGPEALAAGIVDEIADEADLLDRSIEIAATLTSTAGPTLAGLKEGLYAGPLAALRSGEGPPARS
jgi:enoyl-CoA hydratase/carnithine racemase